MSGWIVTKKHKEQLLKFMRMINEKSDTLKIRKDIIKQVEDLQIPEDEYGCYKCSKCKLTKAPIDFCLMYKNEKGELLCDKCHLDELQEKSIKIKVVEKPQW
jgi:hypothetical protein